MSARSSSAILELLIIFALVYALQFVTAFAGLVQTLFVLSSPVMEHPWTVVTSVYAHGGLDHLLSNAIALVVFGWPVARATTRFRFHLFFVTTGALAGVTQILASPSLAVLPLVGAAPTGGVLGASGGVFALLGYLLASNRLSSSLGDAIDVPVWVTALVFIALAIAVTVVTASPQAALIAHFTGLLLGLFAGKVNLLAVSSRELQPQNSQPDL